MRKVFIASAKRTAVSPINGAFRNLEISDLAAPVFSALTDNLGLAGDQIDQVIMGNALYGGGNPARVAALAADFPESLPAMTIDTQCCSGLDAILLGASMIRSGVADVVIAGGVESYSRAPRRFQRAKTPNGVDQEYERPPFTPWPDRDPDMLEAAAALAKTGSMSRVQQEEFAIESHRKALINKENNAAEIVSVAGVQSDSASRNLSHKLCSRLPVIAGDNEFGLTSATVALKADAAAAVLLVSETALLKLDKTPAKPVELVAGLSLGSDPEQPALAPIFGVRQLLKDRAIEVPQIKVLEVMEAFAVQAMECLSQTGLDLAAFNVGGGALARGHPIGASGAINAVRLFHQLQSCSAGSYGLATIAAAGGLSSTLLLQR
ncbi:acetyl-CoA C-acyltransferase [Sneathiella limimaris]|uniref:acetyl-CoA C-acyltransferase n=1 Tax=Sneathiella limimaris TaxID=1964213 RepID=UPI00146BC2E1